jgi:hypothetical protein
MRSRGTAIAVAVAVVAGIAVAAVGLANRGSSKPAGVLQIDEVDGRVGKVVLGETRENVLGVLGPPTSSRPGTMAYPHLTVGLRGGRVVTIATDDPAAQTEQVVRVGDPLSAARASYRKAASCNPDSPDKTARHPRCVVKVPVGRLLIVGDPIRTMTLERA